MNNVYHAAVYKEDGYAYCEFLDIPGVIVKGKDENVSELIATASAVCADTLEGRLKNDPDPKIPEPMTFEAAIQAAEGAPVVLIDVPLPSRTVKVMISVPEDKLHLIDLAARIRRQTRSAYLVNSAIAASR